jgi:hypothetical protein
VSVAGFSRASRLGVSFGKGNLSWVKRYIANQKQHHAKGKIQDRLERTTMDDDARPIVEA